MYSTNVYCNVSTFRSDSLLHLLFEIAGKEWEGGGAGTLTMLTKESMVMTMLVAAAANGGPRQGKMAPHPEHISFALPRPPRLGSVPLSVLTLLSPSPPPRLPSVARSHSTCTPSEINQSTGAVGVCVRLNEQILSSNSSYILRVLYTSFDAHQMRAEGPPCTTISRRRHTNATALCA